MKSRFSLHGIEFQQTGKRICRTFVVEKAQASVRQVTNVLSGKLHIQPSGTRRPNDTFGVERSGIIDRKVADRHIAASFQVKRRDKAGEEKLRAGSFDRKIPHAFQIEGDPFQTLVVVAYELIFFFGPVRTQPQFAARQYETGRTGLRTVCHCRPYRRNSIAFGRCRIEKVAQRARNVVFIILGSLKHNTNAFESDARTLHRVPPTHLSFGIRAEHAVRPCYRFRRRTHDPRENPQRGISEAARADVNCYPNNFGQQLT